MNKQHHQSAPEIDQHYVSKFYLRKFIARDLPPGANRQLWVADLDTKRVETRSPTTISNLEYFYEQRDPSSPLPRIETVLKMVEDRVAPVLKALEAEAPPDNLDLRPLCLFIALQVARTPLGRRTMEAQLERERAESTIHRPEGDAFPRPRDKLMAIFWDIARYLEANPNAPDAALLNTVVRAVRDFVPKLQRAAEKEGWLFLEAPEGYAYTTSDQPAVILAQEGTSFEDASAGRGTVHVVFPQSPKNLLVICLDPSRCAAPAVHAGLHVDKVNDLVLFSAETQVYCSTRALAERALWRAPDVRSYRKGQK